MSVFHGTRRAEKENNKQIKQSIKRVKEAEERKTKEGVGLK